MNVRDSLLTVVLGTAAGLCGAFVYGKAVAAGPEKSVDGTLRASSDLQEPKGSQGSTAGQAGRRKLRADSTSVDGLKEATSRSAHSMRDDDDDNIDEEWRARDVAKHERQAVDPVWSKKAELSFSADLERASGSIPFDVEKLDCRSSSCLAVLKYDDFAKAKKSTGQLVHDEHMGLNCARTVFAPDPADREAQYRATVVFDCEDGSN